MSPAANPKRMRELTIEEAREGGTCRLLLRGELDLTSAAKLLSAVSQLCAQGVREIVLDVAELAFVDSTGLRAILDSRALCEERLCQFAIVPEAEEVNEQMRRLLEITGLRGRLPFRKADG